MSAQKARSNALPTPVPCRWRSTPTGPRCQCGCAGSWRDQPAAQLSIRVVPPRPLPATSAWKSLSFLPVVAWQRPDLDLRQAALPIASGTSTSFVDPALAVYNVPGRRMRLLADGEQTVGEHAIHWDGRGSAGSSVGDGLYSVRLDTASHSTTELDAVIR
jgi:hypothetical protein